MTFAELDDDLTATRTMYPGTVEYLTGEIVADLTITDDDTISVSLDHGTSWSSAEWVGAEGTTRAWRILLGTTVPLPTAQYTPVYVRVTDNPEAPVMKAGTLNVPQL